MRAGASEFTGQGNYTILNPRTPCFWSMARLITLFLLLLSLFLLLLPQIPYLLLWPVVRLAHVHLPWRPFLWAGIVLVAGWWVLYAYGHFHGRFHCQVRRVEYAHPHVPPAFNGFRIVQVSDLHLQSWQQHHDRLQKAVQQINALNPHLIVFTGDLVSYGPQEAEPFLPILRQLHATDGIISVMGNHDYSPYARHLTSRQRQQQVERLIALQRDSLHWTLLLNENSILHRGVDSIAMIGVENQSCGTHTIVQRGNLHKAMQGTENLFSILLSHDPSHWRAEVLYHTNIPLTLSGHTHAMQFSLFGFTPAKWAYPECAGRYNEGSQTLYVNRGLGETLLPMRLGARPEITLITLRSL